MEQVLTDWKPKHGSSVKFSHVEHSGSYFEGVIRGSTIGKVLMQVDGNTEPYVWFLKNEITLL